LNEPQGARNDRDQYQRQLADFAERLEGE
jgi:hypothetical protein